MSRQNSMDDRSQDGKPFGSNAEITAAIRDSRYRTDEAYEARVKSRIAATPEHLVGGNNLNLGQPGSDNDNVNFAGPIHSIAEASILMSDPRYKSDPYFRAQVAEGIRQSTPGWTPRTGDDSLRVQFSGDDSE